MKTFKDLEFKPRGDGKFGYGVGAKYTFDNDVTISVQAGRFNYSTPREDLTSPNDFTSFEVAVLESPNGDLITTDFVPDAGDDVLGWQDRAQINELMLLIQSENN